MSSWPSDIQTKHLQFHVHGHSRAIGISGSTLVHEIAHCLYRVQNNHVAAKDFHMHDTACQPVRTKSSRRKLDTHHSVRTISCRQWPSPRHSVGNQKDCLSGSVLLVREAAALHVSVKSSEGREALQPSREGISVEVTWMRRASNAGIRSGGHSSETNKISASGVLVHPPLDT